MFEDHMKPHTLDEVIDSLKTNGDSSNFITRPALLLRVLQELQRDINDANDTHTKVLTFFRTNGSRYGNEGDARGLSTGDMAVQLLNKLETLERQLPPTAPRESMHTMNPPPPPPLHTPAEYRFGTPALLAQVQATAQAVEAMPPSTEATKLAQCMWWVRDKLRDLQQQELAVNMTLPGDGKLTNLAERAIAILRNQGYNNDGINWVAPLPKAPELQAACAVKYMEQTGWTWDRQLDQWRREQQLEDPAKAEQAYKALSALGMVWMSIPKQWVQTVPIQAAPAAPVQPVSVDPIDKRMRAVWYLEMRGYTYDGNAWTAPVDSQALPAAKGWGIGVERKTDGVWFSLFTPEGHGAAFNMGYCKRASGNDTTQLQVLARFVAEVQT